MPKVKPRSDLEYKTRLDKAIEALNKPNPISIRSAAGMYGVSKTTLGNRFFERAKPRNQAHVTQQLLTEEEEIELVKWTQRLDKIGIPSRLTHLHEMVAALLRKRATGTTTIPGQHWITRFLDRHPTIASRFAGRIDQEREVAGKPDGIQSFFNRLGEVRSRYHIAVEDIWNADEKGFALGVAKKGKVICGARRRNPRIRHPGNREWVTLMETISATGKVLSPLYIYKGEAHTMGNHDYQDRDPAAFALSKTGWTNDKVGLLWLTDHFEPNTQSATGHPRLLIIDGHSSHLTLEFIEFCSTHEIQLLCFPPHSTHLLQPLDVGIFSPLGRYYSNEVDDWGRAHPYQTISKGDFFPLCQRARQKALTIVNIKASFAATGIHPFRRARVLEIINKSSPPTSSTTQLLQNTTLHPSGLSTTSFPSTSTGSEASSVFLPPETTKQVAQLKNLLVVSHNVHVVKNIGVALATTAGTALAAATIAEETVRRIASAPKKSKSHRRHISKAVLVSRSYLDKARNLRLQKEAEEVKKKERKAIRVKQELLAKGVNRSSGRKGKKATCVPEDLSPSDIPSPSTTHSVFPSSSRPLDLSTRPPLYPISSNSQST